MDQAQTYSIKLDGDWSLKDFYEFPHTFAQVYAFHYAFRSDAEVRDHDRLAHAFASYPWRGGYSAVNFYNVLANQIPLQLRPQVKSVRYSSPGLLELTLLVAAAASVGKVVKIFIDAIERLHEAYSTIYKGMQERKLLRLSVQRQQMSFSREQLQFVEESSDRLARLLGFGDLQELNSLTGNPVATLKILMSYYRRVRTLAEFQTGGKLSLPGDER